MTNDDAQRVLVLAEAATPGRAGSDEARGAALRAVEQDVGPAIEHFLVHDRAAALRLVGALAIFWQDVGHVDEGRQLTERAVEGSMRTAAADNLIAGAIPGALLAASELAFRQGDQEAATKRAHDCIRAAMLVEDRVTASLAHSNLARVAYRDGDAAQIEHQARRALDLAGDDTLAVRGALHMLAWAAHTAGDLDEAERRFETSLDYRRRHAGRLSVAVEIANLGDLAVERGQLARAATLLSEALLISHQVGSVYMLVNTLPSVAVLAARAGQHEDAARLFGAGDAAAAASGLLPDPNSSVDEARTALRTNLDAASLARLEAEGDALSDEAAVELALAVAGRLR